MLYIGGVVAILDQTSTTMFRSLISKTVEPNEVGKVFSIVGTFQALLPFMASPAFNFLYGHTVGYFPSAFVYLIMGIRAINFFIILVVNIGMRKEGKRKERHEDELEKKLDKEEDTKEDLMKDNNCVKSNGF